MTRPESPGPETEQAGCLIPGGHELRQRVYFEDTDFTGLVYHARYLHFMERGRSDYLRLLGVSHRALEAEDLFFAVHSITIHYRAPAKIDDIVTIRSLSDFVGGARINLKQSVLRDQTVLTDADVSVVLLRKNGKPARIPDEVRAMFASRSLEIEREPDGKLS